MKQRKPISKSQRYDVLVRDNFTCQYCGRSAPDVKLEIDHVLPVSKGGNNNIENLKVSCYDCNRGKSNKFIKKSKQLKNVTFDDMMIRLYAGIALINNYSNNIMLELTSEIQNSNMSEYNESILFKLLRNKIENSQKKRLDVYCCKWDKFAISGFNNKKLNEFADINCSIENIIKIAKIPKHILDCNNNLIDTKFLVSAILSLYYGNFFDENQIKNNGIDELEIGKYILSQNKNGRNLFEMAGIE